MLEMEDEPRRELLGMDEEALMKVAEVANRFPAIDLAYEVTHEQPLVGGDKVQVQVGGA